MKESYAKLLMYVIIVKDYHKTQLKKKHCSQTKCLEKAQNKTNDQLISLKKFNI